MEEGGARTPQVKVPAARYYPKSDGPGACRNLLNVDPFDWEHLGSGYGSSDGFTDEMHDAADRLEDEGWLVPADAEQIRADLN